MQKLKTESNCFVIKSDVSNENDLKLNQSKIMKSKPMKTINEKIKLIKNGVTLY